MNWEKCFAGRAALMQQSTVREFLKQAARPGMISFAGGLPDPDLLPVEETRAAVDRALTLHGSRALQYGITEGLLELRELIAARYHRVGVTPENVLITTGSQQVLDLIGRLFLDETSTVAVQNPTYLAALSVWRSYGAKFAPGTGRSPLPTNQRLSANLIYCIPNFINPTGDSMDHNQRSTLVDYSLRKGIPLLEDDPYGDLRYDESPKPPSLLELAGELTSPVLHVGTISKVLAPGFRIGWIVAPTQLIAKLAVAKQGVDLHTSTFSQYVACELLKSALFNSALPRLRLAYASKRDALLAELRAQMPSGITWTHPAGGFFLLLTLPTEVDGSELASRALEVGVAVVPGGEFHARGGTNTLRLSFSNASRPQIAQGVTRLSQVIRHVSTEKAPVEEAQRALV
jgi:2-aminoadipate transaminase